MCERARRRRPSEHRSEAGSDAHGAGPRRAGCARRLVSPPDGLPVRRRALCSAEFCWRCACWSSWSKLLSHSCARRSRVNLVVFVWAQTQHTQAPQQESTHDYGRLCWLGLVPARPGAPRPGLPPDSVYKAAPMPNGTSLAFVGSMHKHRLVRLFAGALTKMAAARARLRIQAQTRYDVHFVRV